MGNGKFYEIGTSLAETAVITNGIYGKRVDTRFAIIIIIVIYISIIETYYST